MGDFINAEVKPDMVVWTGDITPHDIYEYTIGEVQEYTEHFSNWMKTALKDYPVYPVEGNHDFELANSQRYHPKDPMIDFTLEHWKQWLTPEAQTEFAKNGHYSQPLKLADGSVVPNARFIGINTEAAYFQQIYNLSMHFDATGVLDWLEATLAEMEKNGEIAILAGHIPNGDASINAFVVRYQAILERYQHIVRTQVYGHVH